MNNLSLDNQNWKAFFIEDVAEINSGKDIYERERIEGSIPYITATANNNGIGYFVANENDSLESGCLSVNRNGSVGYCFYHPYKALYGNDTRKLRPKINNKYVSLFISICITRQREKYGYGYKMGTGRLKRQRILLPVDEYNNPNWAFMEAYMKQKEQQILKPTIDKLCKLLIINNITGGGKSLCSNWKEFIFGEEFSIQSTNSGIDKNKLNQKEGDIPYVTRSDLNNGMDMFVTEQPLRYKVDEGNVITIGLDTQTVFYQPTSFYTGQNIQTIRHAELDRYNAMFLIVAIKKLVEKFSWGSYGATLTRLRKSRIYLPATDKGEIDFAFMSAFMKDVEHDILDTTLKMFNGRISVNKCKQGGVNWKEFNLIKWFTPIKGNQNNMAKLNDGDIPLVSAKKCDNGYKCFVGDNGKRLFEGNIITLNNDGDGGAGLAYYQPYKMALDSHVTALIPKVYLNYYTLCFVTMCISKQREKFGHGYSLNNGRIKAFKFMLPINANNTPDWSYMENYMRNIENEQILLYLNTINRY